MRFTALRSEPYISLRKARITSWLPLKYSLNITLQYNIEFMYLSLLTRFSFQVDRSEVEVP